MKYIKTEETRMNEKIKKVISRIEKAGYIVNRVGSNYRHQYDIKKEKGMFKDWIQIVITLREIRFIGGWVGSKENNEKKFCEELEKKTKIEIVKYI